MWRDISAYASANCLPYAPVRDYFPGKLSHGLLEPAVDQFLKQQL